MGRPVSAWASLRPAPPQRAGVEGRGGATAAASLTTGPCPGPDRPPPPAALVARSIQRRVLSLLSRSLGGLPPRQSPVFLSFSKP